MSGRQGLQGRDEIADAFVGRSNADPPAELLQHVDAGSPVRRIHHQMHRSIRLEYAAQGLEPGIRVGQMMQHPGADDLVEARLQLANTLDRQLVKLQIVEFVGASAVPRCTECSWS